MTIATVRISSTISAQGTVLSLNGNIATVKTGDKETATGPLISDPARVRAEFSAQKVVNL